MSYIPKFFHQSTKIKYEKNREKTPDFSAWPKEWKTIYFKEYPRLERVLLPKPERLDFSIGEAIKLRRSEREFNGEPVSLKNLSQLLFYSAGIIEKKEGDWHKSRRAYPSSGARFPLEIYLLNLKVSPGLNAGTYHYNVKEHSLEKLFNDDKLREKIYPRIIWQEMAQKAPVILAILAVFDRNMMKYQDRGYRYILFEAGHLGQNVYLMAKALGLKCCGLGGFDDDKLHELLDVDIEEEAVLYALAVGN